MEGGVQGALLDTESIRKGLNVRRMMRKMSCLRSTDTTLMHANACVATGSVWPTSIVPGIRSEGTSSIGGPTSERLSRHQAMLKGSPSVTPSRIAYAQDAYQECWAHRDT
jgi:hypothetical protein